MLNREQLAWLEDALDEKSSSGDRGCLVGKTYAEMAEIFNRETGAKLSPEGLRYHVRNLGKKGLPRGRQPYRSDEHKWVGEIGHLLLAITRWSPNRVYLLLQVITGSIYPPISSVSFYKLLAAIKPAPSRLFDHPPGHVLDRYKLRLHQVIVIDTNDEPFGIWLVGFEAYTGFCHAQWFEFRYKRQHAKPGRPRKIPPAKDSLTALLRPDSSIQLPNSRVVKFCRECQSRIFLPLTQFQLPHGYSPASLREPLKFTRRVPAVTADRLPDSRITILASCATKMLEQGRRRALRWLDRHNRLLAQESIAGEWLDILPKLPEPEPDRKKLRWGNFDKRRKRWPDDEALREFYQHHPRYPGKLTPLSRNVKLLRLEKKPDESGKVG